MTKKEIIISFIKSKDILYKPSVFLKNSFNAYILYPIRKIRNKFLFQQFYNGSTDEVIKEASEFIEKYGFEMIPFNFTLKYRTSIKVFNDHSSGYPYVIIDGHKVFFPKTSNDNIIKAVKDALMEQDNESPHNYISENHNVHGHTAVLIGASDGIFALEIMDSFKHIFLFECDPLWLTPVTLTLEPYKDKCTVVNKFVSSKDEKDNITLDTFYDQYQFPIDFMQHDVEGNSLSILKGSSNILVKNNIHLSIACYHTASEAQEVEDLLIEMGYSCSYSKKFVLLWMQKLEKPYIRKGVIYASKETV
jgi:hypothetical protein